MDDDTVLKQPMDRRIGDSIGLPPGPPGVDGNDAAEKHDGKENTTLSAKGKSLRRRSTSRRRSSSRRRSNSRNAVSPSSRRRRSPSRSPTPPRRGRYDSPEYNRYAPRRRYDRRRTPDRRRSPPRRGRRERYGRSRSRSNSLPRRGGGRALSPAGRWSPKKKPASPPLPPPAAQMQAGPPPQLSHPPQAAPYGVMPPQMYGQGHYVPPSVYGHQYGMPPPNAFPAQGPPQAYGMQAPPPQADFSAGYGPPPPGAWGVNEYGQQVWMQQSLPPTGPPSGPEQRQQPSLAVPTQQQQPPPQQQQMMPVRVESRAPEEMSTSALESGGLPPQDAVAQEAENQKDELKRQRANYIKKVALLNKEMKVLKDQREDLADGDAPLSPTTQNFIEENDRLQTQIKKKLDTIENVIDMLNGIIGDEEDDHEDSHHHQDTRSKSIGISDDQEQQQHSKTTASSHISSSTDTTADSSDSSSSSNSSSDASSDQEGDEENGDGSPTNRLKDRAIRSMKAKQQLLLQQDGSHTIESKTAPAAYNYVFFDPEQHWCTKCSVFPKTARDFLKHLHTDDHMSSQTVDTPWHIDQNQDLFPVNPNAPSKRVPVRGLEFLVPAHAWFCKLCKSWIGDLHCASNHLKSKTHSMQYETKPHYEMEWLAGRERALQQQKQSEEIKLKKVKKDEDKAAKKRKKKSDKKKKKRKHSKKHKRNATTAANSSSSSDSSSSEDEQPKKGRIEDASINASSIRVAMRNKEAPVVKEQSPQQPVVPPPPPIIKDSFHTTTRVSKWSAPTETLNPVAKAAAEIEEQKKRDEAMMQQWNTVQPVISESEKKLLEQLKGKLKNKTRDGAEEPNSKLPATKSTPAALTAVSGQDEKAKRNAVGRRSRSPQNKRRSRSHSRSRSRGRHNYQRDRERERERDRRRTRSRSRSRGRRRYSRSPVRSNRRSRSRDNRRRRSKSRSNSRNRVEKPVVKHPEFRPRAMPERKPNDKRDKKESNAKAKVTKNSGNNNAATAAVAAAAAAGGKKLPFIGKMPVFKKQPSTQVADGSAYTNGADAGQPPPPPPPPTIQALTPNTAAVRPLAPTVAQIQMAMMEDAYGNAPPFHPDAGMIMDYDELMPDPVQFANLMTQCAPPPPPPGANSNATAGGQAIKNSELQDDDANTSDGEGDVLPPGIDEAESDLLPQPLDAAVAPRDSELPKDLAEALDIIFPSERPDDEAENEKMQMEPKTITTIVDDEPTLDEHHMRDLANQGIHIVTIEENADLASASHEEANSQENVVNYTTAEAITAVASPMQLCSDDDSEGIYREHKAVVQDQQSLSNGSGEAISVDQTQPITINLKHADAVNIPMPCTTPPHINEYEGNTNKANNIINDELMDLANIPQPPVSPTDSEKMRRQAELEELAMLGIDSSDMAAQYAL